MKTYYQPELSEDFLNKNPNFYSFFVFRSRKLAEKVFPTAKILTFTGEDIEKPTYVDYQYYKSVYSIDIKPFENEMSKTFGFKIKLNKRIGKNSNNIPRFEFQSQNLINKSGIFALPLQEVVLGNFGGGTIINGVMWLNIHLFYNHKDGGSNGLKICDAWYFVDTKTWKFEYVKNTP